jgi:phage baseplate assembly protein W
MTATSYPEGFVELVDAKDEVVKADTRTTVADALLMVERRITLSTYWILGIVVGTVIGAVGIATAILLAAFQSMSGT